MPNNDLAMNHVVRCLQLHYFVSLVWVTNWSYVLLQLFTKSLVFYQPSYIIFFGVHANYFMLFG